MSNSTARVLTSVEYCLLFIRALSQSFRSPTIPGRFTNLTKNDDDDDDDDAKEEEPAHHSDDIDSKSDSDDSGVEKEPSNEELESIESALHQELLNSSQDQGGF